MQKQVLAIDFGTSNTVCCFSKNDGIEVLSFNNGDHMLPSVISFGDKLCFGLKQPGCLHYLKLLIGENLGSLRKLGIDPNIFGKQIVEKDNQLWVMDKDKLYSVQNLLTGYISYVKELGETMAGNTFDSIVLTVPARFNREKISLYVDSVKEAGLKTVKVIKEPVAAVYEFLQSSRTIRNSTILVYDLGGESFNCSLVEVKDDNTLTVLCSDGSSTIGSDIFDEIILQYILDKIKDANYQYFSRKERPSRYEDILKKIVTVKESISSTPGCIDVSGLIRGSAVFSVEITESILYKILVGKVEESLAIVDRMLRNVPLEFLSLNILPIGGGSFLPIVRQRLQNHFERCTFPEVSNLKEIVAVGALRSYLRNDFTFRKVTEYNYSLQMFDGWCVTMIERGTPIPMKQPVKKKFTYIEKNQEVAETVLYEGISEDFNENRRLEDISFDISKMNSEYFYIEIYIDEERKAHIRGYEEDSNVDLFSRVVTLG